MQLLEGCDEFVETTGGLCNTASLASTRPLCNFCSRLFRPERLHMLPVLSPPNDVQIKRRAETAVRTKEQEVFGRREALKDLEKSHAAVE